MSEENNITEEKLKGIAPVLSEIDRSNCFVVPEAYFDKLPAVIQQRCDENLKAGRMFVFSASILKPKQVFQYAVVIILIFLGIFFLVKKQVTDSRKNSVVTQNDSNRLQQNVFIFDEETDESELTDAIAGSDGAEIQPMDLPETANISSEDIIDYLLAECDENDENEF
jgi:hypothetical protein